MPRACRLGLIGDLGQTENSAQTLEHLAATGAASVVNVGDLSYADGYAPRWDSYMRLTAPHTQRVAWALIEGNHEQEVCACMGVGLGLRPKTLTLLHRVGCLQQQLTRGSGAVLARAHSGVLQG